jgi:hypothetical protein
MSLVEFSILFLVILHVMHVYVSVQVRQVGSQLLHCSLLLPSSQNMFMQEQRPLVVLIARELEVLQVVQMPDLMQVRQV